MTTNNRGKKTSIMSRFYNSMVGILLKPFFRVVANFFSHGATHFIFLFVIGTSTFYLWKINNQEKITPHSLGVYVGYLSTYKEGLRELKPNSETIENVSIRVMLNSKWAKALTNGKYSNSVVVLFDGKAVRRVIRKPREQKSPLNLPQYDEYSFIDSMVVSLYSDPFIKDCAIHARIDSVLGKKEEVDSVTGNHIITTYQADNTNVDYDIINSRDGSATVFISPLMYKVGATRHQISFYTDDIGVKKNDPYYYYYISFPTFDFSGDLEIIFSTSDLNTTANRSIVYNQEKSLQYNFIYPEPDVVSNGIIAYYTQEKKEQIRNNRGVVIQAVDIDALNRQNRHAFLFSVLIGTGFAFLIDIIIQLIRELRRLQRKKSTKDSEGQIY